MRGIRVMPTRLTACFACAFVCLSVAHAQFGRGVMEWSTSGGDAHRSSSVATDPKISMNTLSKPGFALVWKMKLNNEPRQLNGLTPPTLMDRHIGIHGFRSFAFVGGSADNLYAVDTDLARIEWQKNFSSKSSQQDASLTCPGGMTNGTAGLVGTAFPAAQGGRGGGGGRGTPAKSGVGEPGEGGVTLAELAARAAAAASGANPGRGGRGGGGGGRGQRMAVVVNSLSSDGMFHANYVSNGDEPNPAIRFLPANANSQGLIVVDNVAYVATAGGCGGVPNGIWALDLAGNAVTSWKPATGEVAGSAGPAFGPDGTLYVATTRGDLVSLEAKTLKVKDVYIAGQELTSSPVIFPYKEKALLAVTTKDGRIQLLDSAAMAGPGSRTASYSAASDFIPGALATWQDGAGTRWLLAPAAGPVAAEAKFTASNGSVTNGAVTNGAIVAWKVVEQNGAAALEPGWVSRDLASPMTPLVVNGVVFAVSSGEYRGKGEKMTVAQRAQRSVPAVVYALDGATGKELWNSGKTIASFVHGGGLSGGAGQIYLGTHDGTLYSFGFPIEH
jgi:outer membrane protein assembly factor BamB